LDSILGGAGKSGSRKSKSPKDEDALENLIGGKKKAAGDDELDKLLSTGAGGAAALGGGRPRPTALSSGFGEEDRSASHGLPSVAEEESSDVAEQSHESRGSNAQRKGVKVVKATKVTSPAMSSPGSALEQSVGLLEASQASASCNEVSVSPDYSVEDSLELEKCDHWEKVQPNSPGDPPKKFGELKVTPKLQPLGALHSAGSVPSSASSAASTRPNTAASVSAAATTSPPAPVVGLAASGLGPKPSSVGVTNQSEAASPSRDKAGLSKTDGDEDYGHESFEETSMDESIDESVDGSGGVDFGAESEEA
jgi:hypothetical protein